VSGGLDRNAVTVCPKCGTKTVPAAGIHTVNERTLAPGFTLGTEVHDTPHVGPLLVDVGTDKTPDYWVCQTCQHEWEQAGRQCAGMDSAQVTATEGQGA